MIKAGFLKRLEKLEQKYKKDPIVVLARNDDGSESEVLLCDIVSSGELGRFIRVVRGSNLKDLDAYLNAIVEHARSKTWE